MGLLPKRILVTFCSDWILSIWALRSCFEKVSIPSWLRIPILEKSHFLDYDNFQKLATSALKVHRKWQAVGSQKFRKRGSKSCILKSFLVRFLKRKTLRLFSYQHKVVEFLDGKNLENICSLLLCIPLCSFHLFLIFFTSIRNIYMPTPTYTSAKQEK